MVYKEGIEKMTENNYFQKCDDRVNLAYAGYYWVFLQGWAVNNITDFASYDKVIFWFKHNKLDKVELVRLGTIVKSFSRAAWMYPSFDLDSRYQRGVDDYADEFTANEDLFCAKIIFHWSFTPLSETEFLVGISKESFTFA